MAALDTASIVIEKGNLWVGNDAGSVVDFGALRNIRFMADQMRTRIESDNRGTILTKVRLQGKVECDWLEPGNMAKVEEAFKGLVARTTTASTPVVGATQALASPFVPNTFYEFANQQGNATVPTSVSLSGATDGTLALNTDYHIIQDPSTLKWGIILNTVAGGPTITTLSQVVTITYSYTPNASQTITGGTNQTATVRYVKIIAPSEDDSNVTREIILQEALCTSPITLNFVDVEAANDAGVMPLVFESNKGTLFTIEDEVNPS